MEGDVGLLGPARNLNERRQRRLDFDNILIPSAAARVAAGEDALIEDDADAILQVIRGVVETHMPNSSLGRFAQGWSLRLSSTLSRRMAKVELEALSLIHI